MGDTHDAPHLVERIETLSGTQDPTVRLKLYLTDLTSRDLEMTRETAASLVEAINSLLLRPPEAQAPDRY